MKCYICDIKEGEKKNCYYALPSNHTEQTDISVSKIIENNKNKEQIRELLKPYIKTENFEKRELHFKNSSETGKLIQQLCNYKIRYQYCMHHNIRYTFTTNITLTDYLFYGKYYYDIEDEYKLFKNYFNRYYKKTFEVSPEIYKEFNEISDFMIKELNILETNTNKHLNGWIYKEIKKTKNTKKVYQYRIYGDPDFVDDKGIYDLKCVGKEDSKFKQISQVLLYLCLYYSYLDNEKDFKYVKIINPILNRIHYIDLDEFGKENLLKFYKLMFSEYLDENNEIEVI